MSIIFYGFLVRVFFAIVGSFFLVLPGSEGDSAAFHYVATLQCLNNSYEVLDHFKFNGWVYVAFLGKFYCLTFPHEIIGSLLSCIAWFISGIIFLKILQILKIKNSFVLLIYSFLPTSILYSSLILREPYQILFINLLIYLMLLIYKSKNLSIKKKILVFFSIILTIIVLASLHYIYWIFIIFFIAFFLFFYFFKKKIMSIIFFILIFFFSSQYLYNNYISGVYFKKEQTLINAIKTYQFSQNQSRSSYLDKNDLNNDKTFLFNIVFKYFTKPWPKDIQTLSDSLFFLNNLIKLFLILYCLIAFFYKRISSDNKKNLLFFLIMFFLLELLWSLGTSSWGTASRHQVTSLIMLLISFGLIKKNQIINNG